jgi:endonuclease/exonuclease/phosphatase (EEP) superfamily protein YafD
MFWSALVTIFLLYKFGIYFLFIEKKCQYTDNKSISILTHNTAQHLSKWENINILIHKYNPNIIFLQELDKYKIKKYWNKLLKKYPYQTSFFDINKTIGMGVLSKYPILKVENFKLVKESLVFQQKIEIKIDNQIFSLYNIHLTFPWIKKIKNPLFSKIPWLFYDEEIRHKEIEILIKKIKNDKNIIIMSGDFNFTDRSLDYQKVSNLLTDNYRKVGYGMGYTWPINRTPSVNINPAIPIIRIDYIFTSKILKPCFGKVLTETGSDHKPLFIKILN